jgi:cytidylate kinase
MPVITVSRLTGSGGAAIGQQIAERLGANYLNRQIIVEVAHRLGISEAAAAHYDERAEAFVERLARVLWLTDPSLASVNQPEPLPYEATTEAFVAVTRHLVREVAATGNAVIFGHGAQFILARQAGVLHVRFAAPWASRVERVMQRESIGRTEAERRVRAEDQRRASYVRQYYQAAWHAPDPLHLILNTAFRVRRPAFGWGWMLSPSSSGRERLARHHRDRRRTTARKTHDDQRGNLADGGPRRPIGALLRAIRYPQLSDNPLRIFLTGKTVSKDLQTSLRVVSPRHGGDTRYHTTIGFL